MREPLSDLRRLREPRKIPIRLIVKAILRTLDMRPVHNVSA